MTTLVLGRLSRLSSSSKVAADQADALIPLLLKKVTPIGEPATAFVGTNVAGNLSLYIHRAPTLKTSYRVLGLVTFGAGLASTALAAYSKSDATRVAIAALGVIVGVVTHLIQIWRPAERSGAYYRARKALNGECWAYLEDGGIYEHLAGDRHAQFLKFQAQVTAIESAAAALDEQAEPTAAAPAPPTDPPPPPDEAAPDGAAK
jgi:hypothetical protein